MTVIIHLLAYKDGIECSETSAYKIQTPRNYPEENTQHTEHGESLKSRRVTYMNQSRVIKIKLIWKLPYISSFKMAVPVLILIKYKEIKFLNLSV
jgi:hypothetical protein